MKKKRCLPPLIIASPFEGLGSQWPWNKKSVSQGPNLAPFLLAKSNWVWFFVFQLFSFPVSKTTKRKKHQQSRWLLANGNSPSCWGFKQSPFHDHKNWDLGQHSGFYHVQYVEGREVLAGVDRWSFSAIIVIWKSLGLGSDGIFRNLLMWLISRVKVEGNDVSKWITR